MEKMNASTLRSLFYELLKDKTSAGERVYKARDWPTSLKAFPALLISTPYEKKHSLGRNSPQFNTVTKVQVQGRVFAYDGEDSDLSGEELAMSAIEQFREEVFVQIINNPKLQRLIQQFITVESEVTIDSSGEGHVCQFVIHFDVEYYQEAMDFYPLETEPLQLVEVKHKDFILSGMRINLKK